MNISFVKQANGQTTPLFILFRTINFLAWHSLTHMYTQLQYSSWLRKLAMSVLDISHIDQASNSNSISIGWVLIRILHEFMIEFFFRLYFLFFDWLFVSICSILHIIDVARLVLFSCFLAHFSISSIEVCVVCVAQQSLRTTCEPQTLMMMTLFFFFSSRNQHTNNSWP